MENSIKLSLPLTSGDVENSCIVRSIVRAIASKRDYIEPLLVNEINTAVTECIKNVHKHAYPNPTGDETFTVEIHVNYLGKVVIEVSDHGVGIADIEAAKNPFLNEVEDGAIVTLGFSILRAMTSEFHIESKPKFGTTVTLIFNVKKEG